MPVQNICVGICKLHLQYKLCVGCFRSPLELRKWPTASDEEKELIIEKCKTKQEIYGKLL